MVSRRPVEVLAILPALSVAWLGEWDGPSGSGSPIRLREAGFLVDNARSDTGPARWARARELAESYPDAFVDEGGSDGRDPSPVAAAARGEPPNEAAASVLALAHRQGSGSHAGAGAGAAACSPLRNHGTHFTVQVGVGTPPQHFEVVADTGSSFVIVPSCLCVKFHRCAKSDGCFTGTNKSSTFSMVKVEKKMSSTDKIEVKKHSDKKEGTAVPMAVVTFGTGKIQAAVAQDVVDVGGLRGNMTNGLLLMVNKVLRMRGAFGGILGLGLPGRHVPQSNGGGKPGAPGQPNKGPLLLDIRPPVLSVAQPSPVVHHATAAGAPPKFKMGKGFLEEAKVERFSMCFNDGADGVLRLNTPKVANSLKSIGKMHWGLDFQGISVGKDAATPALFCNQGKVPGQATACGAIPDSGTTVMTGPEDHIISLFGSLCDQWPRCAEAFKKAVEEHKTADKGAGEVELVENFVQGPVEELESDAEVFADGPPELGPAPIAVLRIPIGGPGGGPDIAGILEGLAHAEGPPREVFPMPPRPFQEAAEGGAVGPHGAAVMERPGKAVPPMGDHGPSGPGGLVPRLQQLPGNGPGREKAPTKHAVFAKLVHDCHSWMTSSTGLDELPPIHLHLGSDDKRQSLKLPGSGYVLEMMQDELEYGMKRLMGIIPVVVARKTGKKEKVCNPAFGVMNFTTKGNGPVWILGTPLFYQYQVGYDLSTEPPSISFVQEQCGSCEGAGAKPTGAALLQGEGVESRAGPRPPRFVRGPFREPSYDLSEGL